MEKSLNPHIFLKVFFIIDLLLKGKKRVNSNKQFKEVKKLKEKLDLGIISKEEYEIEKNREKNKRVYQVIIFALAAAFISLVISVIMQL